MQITKALSSLCCIECIGHAAGWQLTEVDEPYRAAATAVRAAAAADAAKEPALDEGLTGGDPDAISHPAQATESQPTSSSQSQHDALSHHSSSPRTGSSGSSSSASFKSILSSAWASVVKLIAFLVSKLMYALNSILSSMEIPGWALRGMSALAMGPMHNKLLHLYAEGGDHSRRLSSVAANGKFSSIQAGPDEPWEVGNPIYAHFSNSTARLRSISRLDHIHAQALHSWPALSALLCYAPMKGSLEPVTASGNSLLTLLRTHISLVSMCDHL